MGDLDGTQCATSSGEPPSAQMMTYSALRLLSLIGGIALMFFNVYMSGVWMISLTIAAAILIRLPFRWFGRSR